jgi:hypothetical protein
MGDVLLNGGETTATLRKHYNSYMIADFIELVEKNSISLALNSLKIGRQL